MSQIDAAFGEGVAVIIRKYVGKALGVALDVRDKQIAALEKRIEQLEARGELKYCGIWQNQRYDRGSFVTLNGGLWAAQMKTTSRPGTDSTWQLAVKSGGK